MAQVTGWVGSGGPGWRGEHTGLDTRAYTVHRSKRGLQALTSEHMFEATKHNAEGKGWNHCPPLWQERAQLLPFHR
jgi:hypothetical protein